MNGKVRAAAVVALYSMHWIIHIISYAIFGAGWIGSLYFISTDPVAWSLMLMRNRNDKNMIFFYGVHQFVWKPVKETLPYIHHALSTTLEDTR